MNHPTEKPSGWESIGEPKVTDLVFIEDEFWILRIWLCTLLSANFFRLVNCLSLRRCAKHFSFSLLDFFCLFFLITISTRIRPCIGPLAFSTLEWKVNSCDNDKIQGTLFQSYQPDCNWQTWQNHPESLIPCTTTSAWDADRWLRA